LIIRETIPSKQRVAGSSPAAPTIQFQQSAFSRLFEPIFSISETGA
jgi:hypothetical protein